MPIDMPFHPFIEERIKGLPTKMGVYALWENNELIYYGKSEGRESSIELRLLSHIRGYDNTCTQKATHFQYEDTVYPNEREEQLLSEYYQQNGQYPRCNKMGT